MCIRDRYAGAYAGGPAGYPPSGHGGTAADAAAAASANAARYQQYRASSSDFSLGRAPSRGGSLSPGHASEFGPDFSDMLARERGPNPFHGFKASESFDARSLSPKGVASRAGEATTERVFDRRDLSSSLAVTASPRGASVPRDLGEVLGVGKVGAEDVLGMYLAARSQQVARRKFLCEIDGKVFSTMNLMRVHFERHYQADAEAWWNRHRRADASFSS